MLILNQNDVTTLLTMEKCVGLMADTLVHRQQLRDIALVENQHATLPP
jgi:hypothetical protein